jgi:hypothetical protein
MGLRRRYFCSISFLFWAITAFLRASESHPVSRLTLDKHQSQKRRNPPASSAHPSQSRVFQIAMKAIAGA